MQRRCRGPRCSSCLSSLPTQRSEIRLEIIDSDTVKWTSTESAYRLSVLAVSCLRISIGTVGPEPGTGVIGYHQYYADDTIFLVGCGQGCGSVWYSMSTRWSTLGRSFSYVWYAISSNRVPTGRQLASRGRGVGGTRKMDHHCRSSVRIAGVLVLDMGDLTVIRKL